MDRPEGTVTHAHKDGRNQTVTYAYKDGRNLIARHVHGGGLETTVETTILYLLESVLSVCEDLLETTAASATLILEILRTSVRRDGLGRIVMSVTSVLVLRVVGLNA